MSDTGPAPASRQPLSTGPLAREEGHDGLIRVASVNLEFGGIDPDGSTVRRDQSVAVLGGLAPHVVLVQELYAPGEEPVRRHFRGLGNALGLEPAALGRPRGSKRLRAGILTDTRVLEVIDDGPAPADDVPYWAEAQVAIRATGTELTLTSVHAPATTATGQLAEAERLGARIAQRGMLAVTGGDWNCYTPFGMPDETELAELPLHLRPSRIRRAPDDRLIANLDVHDILTAVGMRDPVPALSPARRVPPHPGGTGSHPRARVDRFHLWPGDELLPAVTCYHQLPNPGSDHQVCVICLDPAVLAQIAAPGPQP